MSATLDEHLRNQLSETREEISRADNKASILLAGAGVALGTVVAGLIAGDVSVRSMPALVLMLAGVATVAALAGLAHAGAAIWPHCGKAEPGRARYFTEVAAYGTPEDLAEAIERDHIEGDRLLHQVHGLSQRVLWKYDHLRRGMTYVAAGILLACAAGAADLIIG